MSDTLEGTSSFQRYVADTTSAAIELQAETYANQTGISYLEAILLVKKYCGERIREQVVASATELDDRGLLYLPEEGEA